MSQNSGALQTDSTPAPDKRTDGQDETNIKETIESILVAFILAFIFRAFVVEAFVIPTGSMAPTLLGAHMRYQCPDCGYTFDVNYSSRNAQDDEDMRTPPDAFPAADVYCPNCGFHIASPQGQSSTPSPVNYGDRILVLKYLYLMHPARRWDVVVFKSPDEPQTEHYQQNFIKRLVGLPGERLMVLAGDIYVWNSSKSKWEIPHKTRSAQEALWRIVYDNDFHPHLLKRPSPPRWEQPWKQDSGSGWDLTSENGGRIFKFDNAGGEGGLTFDPNANSTTQTLSDYLVYDTGSGPGTVRQVGSIGSVDDSINFPVADLKLVASYTRKSGSGAFEMKLSRFEDVDHTFTAQITPDTVRLIHRTSSGEITTVEKSLAELGIRGDRPIFVEFMNVDYRVTLRLNGKDAFEPMDYEPNVPWLMDQWSLHRRGRPGEAQIDAERQTCTIEHVGLWRDVYYTNQKYEGGGPLHSATPDNPVQLGPREYFTMGDNSAISKDARYWDAPIDLPHEGLDHVAEGRVPEQFLLGKAVFVYWPAGYRAYDHLAIIPNFGDMRWIH
ncbi:MAG TPA: S26 family signal peptidase [Tepidisphaeraceae bacterium]|jgi:signal peptidase I|nr:S26 family signal peptidase [Tepidisphaeraceae bacterium]